MYNFMIVDDDKLVRERILSLIPYEALELHLCGQAENGVQALEVFQNAHPQIVLVDINIPLINGIDVAKAMLQEDPDVNVVVITGYGTLQTAQEAIRSGIMDFLLKPVDGKELHAVLSKIIQKLQMENKAALEQQRIERLLERSMPLLRSRYFLSLIRKPAAELDEADCREHLMDFGIPMQVSDICVVLLVTNYDSRSVSEQLSLQSILEEELEKRLEASGIGCLFCYDVMQRMILIAYSNQKRFISNLEQKLSAIRDKMRYVHHLDFSASIGTPVPSFCYLQSSYQDAERAFGCRQVFGNNNIVNSATVKNIEPPSFPLPTVSFNELMDLLVAENLDGLCASIDRYLSELSCMPHNSISFIQQKAIELTALLMTGAGELGVEAERPDSHSSVVYVQLLAAGNFLEIKSMLKTEAERIVQGIHNKRQGNKVRALSSAKQYVYKNYASPSLDLAEVSESVSLSPNYVAQLFKRYENCTFTEYLNHVRIERAKQLLSTTNMRVYEVAEAVGYQNSKYFFQLFKQITGMRPREFYESFVPNSK